METGGLAGAVFNAAKEQALDGFISEKIGFLDMARIVEQTIDQIETQDGLRCDMITLDKVQQMDHLARQVAAELTRKTA